MMNDVVYTILKRVNDYGYDAFLIGGAVRDLLLGYKPQDFDICTNAHPKDVLRIFEGENVNASFSDYGMVKIIMKDIECEITTYRKEDGYSDNRHPQKIDFVGTLQEDVSRRDFTINALAMNKDEQIFDYFQGLTDLKNGIIRCIGNPDERFLEDALRIMRGIKLVSTLGFTLEEKTYHAMINARSNLLNLSKGALALDLRKMIEGRYFWLVLERYSEAITGVLKIFDFKNEYQEMLKNVESEFLLKLGAIYYKHYDLLEEIEFIMLGKKEINLLKNGLNAVFFDNLGDVLGQKQAFFHLNKKNDAFEILKYALTLRGKIGLINEYEYQKAITLLNEIRNDCYTIKELAINGDDLISMGIIEGKEIKRILMLLLEKVVSMEVRNEKKYLQMLVVEFLKQAEG